MNDHTTVPSPIEEGYLDEETIRTEVDQLMRLEGLTQTQVAKELGMPLGTFSTWFKGTYQGRSQDKAAEVVKWLEARKIHQKTRAAIPDAPRYIATESAQAFLDTMSYAQSMRDLAVITGAPGIGKTTAIEEYQSKNVNVFLITAHPQLSKPHSLLQEICDTLQIAERSTSRMQPAIVRFLRGKQALIVVDEAQHLSSQALDQLRSIHDLAKTGIVLSGNQTVYGQLEGGSRRAQYAQLFSRVGMRLNQNNPRARDICDIIKAWQVEDVESIKLLKAIGRKPGALRTLTKVIRLAFLLASGDEQALKPSHIRRSYGQLSSETMEG